MGWNHSTSADIVSYPVGQIYTVPAGHHRQHKGLITTNAVKVKRGWVGQVSIDQKIVWETEPQVVREEALELADDRVAIVLGRLFEDSENDA